MNTNNVRKCSSHNNIIIRYLYSFYKGGVVLLRCRLIVTAFVSQVLAHNVTKYHTLL